MPNWAKNKEVIEAWLEMCSESKSVPWQAAGGNADIYRHGVVMVAVHGKSVEAVAAMLISDPASRGSVAVPCSGSGPQPISQCVSRPCSSAAGPSVLDVDNILAGNTSGHGHGTVAGSGSAVSLARPDLAKTRAAMARWLSTGSCTGTC